MKLPLTRLRHSRRLVFAVAWIVGGTALHAGATPWRQLETPRFTVISQLGDRATLAWAGEFNQFVTELSRVFHADRPHLPALTVVLFARDRDLESYKPPRPDGRGPAAIHGFFHHQGSSSVIGLARGYTDSATRELIFHEGVHWFTSTDPVVYPAWLDEGLAEVFSTFRQEGRRVRWGTAVSSHVVRLRKEPMLPFDRFLYVTREDPLFNESHRTGIFYAQSWVFVHYLMFGEHDGARDALGRHMHALAEGARPDDAFRQAFGHDPERMTDTLTRYIRSGRYYKVIRPEATAARITAQVTPAPAPAVEVALGRLALAAQRYDLARPHAERAIALAPDQPGGFELLAQLHERDGNSEAALEAGTRAEQLGSCDAQTLFLLAYSRAAFALQRDELTPDCAHSIAALYLRALAAHPTMEPAYENLAGLIPSLDAPEPQHRTTLQQGARLFPHRGRIVLGLASLEARLGDRTTARHLIAAARARGLPLEDEQRARHLLETWLCDETLARIQELAQAGRWTEAIAAYDTLIPQVTQVFTRGTLQRNRQTLAVQSRFAGAEDAARRGDFATAREMLGALLTDPATPDGFRPLAEKHLRHLPASTSPTAGDEASAP